MTDEEEPEQEIIPLTPEKEHIMAAEIRKLMDEKRLFLQPNLKINDLASMLNTNRNYIYNAINQGIGMSFAEYINKKRIEYAVRLIDKDREMLLADVAHKSGFSSPSAIWIAHPVTIKKRERASLPAPLLIKTCERYKFVLI